MTPAVQREIKKNERLALVFKAFQILLYLKSSNSQRKLLIKMVLRF